MTDNDWTTVTKEDKKRVMRRRGKPRKPSVHQSRPDPDKSLNSSGEIHRKESCLSMLLICQEELESIGVLRQVLQQAPKRKFSNLVCYGVGNFSHSSSLCFSAPLYQVALMLLLRDRWKIASCSFLDPCVTEVELEVLRHHNVRILNNQKGKQTFESAMSLFFMPHCPKQLYENVVWAHFDQLDRIAVLGNSLLNYAESLSVASEENHSCPCLIATRPFVRQALLRLDYDTKEASGNLEGALNDTYWTIFDVDDKDSAILLSRPRLPSQLDQMNELL